MKDKILKEWLKKPIIIGTRNFTYYGRIFEYDEEFIKLNPAFTYVGPHDSFQKMAKEKFEKYEAGKSDLEVILGRRYIEVIENFE